MFRAESKAMKIIKVLVQEHLPTKKQLKTETSNNLRLLPLVGIKVESVTLNNMKLEMYIHVWKLFDIDLVFVVTVQNFDG